MSKCKISGKVLVIQLGRDQTQILLMGKGSEIVHSAAFETPAGAVEDGMIQNPDAVREMLKSALKTPGFRHVRQAVFALCTSQVISDVVTVPELPEGRLEKLLHSNEDMYFSHVDMSDYRLAWQVIGPKNQEEGLKEQLVQLWAVPVSMITPYYTVGNACGLSVVAIDYCGHSIATAVGASFAKSGKSAKKSPAKKKKRAEEMPDTGAGPGSYAGTDLYISLDRELLGMTFVQDGQVVMQRFIQCGSEPAYQFDELSMVVEYFLSMDIGRNRAINCVVCGALAEDRGLMDQLADALGMYLEHLPVDYDPGLVTCVGAANTSLDFGDSSMNRPGKARGDVQRQLWQYIMILIGGLALVFVVMFTLSARLGWNSELSKLKSTVQTLQIQAAQTNGYADNYYAYSNKYDAYSADWDTIFSYLRTYNDNLVLVLDELEKTLPEDASVTGLMIAQDGLQVQFACESKEVAAYLIMALRELKYADLVGITDLQGGGVGPATSYGPPPTEGSSGSSSTLGDLIKQEISEDELKALAASITANQVNALEGSYGAHPTNLYSSLEELKANQTEEPDVFFQQRSDALREMLSTNPFVANRFVDLMLEDFDRGNNAIMLNLIFEDLLALQQQGKLDMTNPIKSIDLLVDLMTRDEETLTATEKLLCTDKSATNTESWYVYYLEVQMKLQPETVLPFLDMEKVVEDLMDGGFNTSDSDLNDKLNGLISEGTRDLLEMLNSPEELGAMLEKFLEEGSTGVDAVDDLIDQYLMNGTTGIPELDERINEYIGSGAINDTVTAMVGKYISTGSTGSNLMDDLIAKYLTTGTTGNGTLDGIINDYIASGALNDSLAGMINGYLTTGTTGSDVFDDLIDRYLATGTTGNQALDSVIDSYIASGAMNEALKNMMNKYLTENSTGNQLFDELIGKFLTTGTTGNPKLDQVINDFIASGAMNDILISMMLKYKMTGTTGNDAMDDLIEKCLRGEPTGIPALDELVSGFLGGGNTPSEPDEPEDPEDPTEPTEPTEPEEPDFDELIAGLTDEKLDSYVTKFLKNNSSGDDQMDKWITAYFKTGTTGHKALDTKLKNYLDKGYADDEIADLMINYVVSGKTGNTLLDSLIFIYKLTGTTGNTWLDGKIKGYMAMGTLGGGTNKPSTNKPSSGTGSGGAAAQPQDTRIFFTAVLGYNDELKNAELVRKGLSYEDKIDKVEVDEE